MTLKSKSFHVYKGSSLDFISQYIEEEIGLDAYLIKDIEAVVLSSTVTQITILYNKYPSKILDSIAPREGAIFTSDVASNDFDVRFLFNYPIDFRSISSGTFKIDSQGIDISNLYLDPNSNNYFLKLKVDSEYQTDAFHTYQISNGLKRSDGSTIDYSPVGGYVFHSLSSAHIGDIEQTYAARKRGKVTVGVLRLSKGLNPQQGVAEYLSQRQISNDMLISYTSVSTSETLSDIYIVYFSKLEPQIIGGFPLNNSLLPSVSAPNKVTLVFNVPLDNAVLKSTPNLFSIEEGFSTSTPINPTHLNLLSDKRTVEIDVSSYFTSEKIYSILVRPGIVGLNGQVKEKPEQWTIHISAYEGTAFTGDITGTGAPLDAPYVLYGESNEELEGAVVLNFNSGLTGITGGGGLTVGSPILIAHTGNTSNPHGTTAAQVGAPTTSQFTGHTGESNIHFTQSDIDIPSSQISDFDAAVGSIITTEVSPFISALISTDNNITNILTGHTGVTGIHYSQDQISITTSQISDFSSTIDIIIDDAIADAITGIGGTPIEDFTGHTGNTSIHYPQSSIAIPSSQITDFNSSVTTIIDTEVNPSLDALSGIITGHTGNSNLHYTQSEISILSSQITDFTEAAQDVVGTTIIGQFGIEIAYNDGAGTVTVGMLGPLYTGLTGHTGSTNNPHDVTAAQVGAPTLSSFTGHTGRLDIHFTEASIDHRNIFAIGTYQHNEIDGYIDDYIAHAANTSNPHGVTASQVGAPTTAVFTGHTGSTNNPHNVTPTQIGAVPTSTFTGHTGRTDVHFAQSEINIPASQISDFVTVSNDLIVAIAGPIYTELIYRDTLVSGYVTGHTGDTSIHYTQGQISIPIDQLSDVNITDLATDDVLKFDGTDWINASLGELGGGASSLDELSDVSLNAFPEHFDILVYDTGVNQYVNAKILEGSIYPIYVPTEAGNYVLFGTNGLLNSTADLSDVNDVDASRKNIKVNYLIEDFLDYSFFNTSDIHGVGSAFIYGPGNLANSNKNTQGIFLSSNGANATAGASASLRSSAVDSFYMYNNSIYYFNIAVTTTGNCLYRFGMINGTSNSEDDITNGLYFEYNSSVGNTWYACTASGTSRTKTNTFLTGSHLVNTFRWFAISGNSSSVRFYTISGSTTGVTNITTTLPHTSTGNCRPFISCVANGATWTSVLIDKFIYPVDGSSLPINI